MDDAGIREALRRLDEAYRKGLERLNRTQALINMSHLTLQGRRLTRRSSWQTSAPDDRDDGTPDAGNRRQEPRHHSDGPRSDRLEADRR